MLFVQQTAGGAADGLPPLAGEPRELLSEPEARSRKRTKWGESPCVDWSLVTLRLGGRRMASSSGRGVPPDYAQVACLRGGRALGSEGARQRPPSPRDCLTFEDRAAPPQVYTQAA